MGIKSFKTGDKVICSESGIVGKVIKCYFPTACEEQTMVRLKNGCKYHAPTRTWSLYTDGMKTSQIIFDEFLTGKNVMIGIDLASSPDRSANVRTPYGKYVLAFSKNHGLSISEAIEHPMVLARLDVFRAIGR